jgi:diketogulonate reductase-like aldo/keto reductase
MIPIIGARTKAQLEENLTCLKTPLSEEHLKRLNDVSAIDLGFPHEFLAKEYIRDLVYAHSYNDIENHRK